MELQRGSTYFCDNDWCPTFKLALVSIVCPLALTNGRRKVECWEQVGGECLTQDKLYSTLGAPDLLFFLKIFKTSLNLRRTLTAADNGIPVLRSAPLCPVKTHVMIIMSAPFSTLFAANEKYTPPSCQKGPLQCVVVGMEPCSFAFFVVCSSALWLKK